MRATQMTPHSLSGHTRHARQPSRPPRRTNNNRSIDDTCTPRPGPRPPRAPRDNDATRRRTPNTRRRWSPTRASPNRATHALGLQHNDSDSHPTPAPRPALRAADPQGIHRRITVRPQPHAHSDKLTADAQRMVSVLETNTRSGPAAVARASRGARRISGEASKAFRRARVTDA